MSSDLPVRARLRRATAAALAFVAAVSAACGSEERSLVDVPLGEWPERHLVTYASESFAVLDELRARAARNMRIEEILDGVYDEASVLAFAGDEDAYAVLVHGVEAGDRSALFRYAEFLLSGASAFHFDPQPENALRALLRSQGLGSEDASRLLCEGFVHGWDGYRPPLPPPGGRVLCENNARRGEGEDVRLVGDLYRLGVDSPPDLMRAFQFYVIASAAGSGLALYELGRMAQSGVEGVPPDLSSASGYFIQAVQAGETRALMPAITLLESGPPEVRDLVRAFSLWELAWDLGVTAGAWGMSRAFRCGLGVSVSPVESEYWSGQAGAALIPDPEAAVFARSPCPLVPGLR